MSDKQHRPWPRLSAGLEPLARAIAGTIPGLAGYVGVDLILTPRVRSWSNPRLTTAYAALTEALDINVAAAILGVFDQVLAPRSGPAGRRWRCPHRPVTTP